jgi:fatty acid desaturase
MRSPYERLHHNLIDKEDLRLFAGTSTKEWLGAVALEWIIIGATVWTCNALAYWWLWVVGFFIIGTRQHALAVLAHDGAHHLVARSLFWNDLLSNFLAAYPMVFTTEGFRSTHLKHHWYLETPDDPSKISVDLHPHEWTFPMPKKSFVGMILRDLTGLSQRASASLLKYLWDIPGGKRKHIILLIILHGFFITLCAFTGYGWTYVLLWILPLFTVSIACYRVRSIAEHSGFGPQEGRYARTLVDSLISTRTTIGGPVLQFIFAPYNITYHIEHHLYPYVPVFYLRKLHGRLRENPIYASNAHITRGYLQLFRELTAANGESNSTRARSESAISTSDMTASTSRLSE